MALVKCPECKKSVSSHAENCPRCGYPIAKTLNQANNDEINQNCESKALNNSVSHGTQNPLDSEQIPPKDCNVRSNANPKLFKVLIFIVATIIILAVVLYVTGVFKGADATIQAGFKTPSPTHKLRTPRPSSSHAYSTPKPTPTPNLAETYVEAAYDGAVKLLSSQLRNPSSLTVNSTSGTFIIDSETIYYNFIIDYSAMNGFGGYNRDTFYCAIECIPYTSGGALCNEFDLGEYLDMFDSAKVSGWMSGFTCFING